MTRKITFDASKLLGNNSNGAPMTGTGKPKLVKLPGQIVKKD